MELLRDVKKLDDKLLLVEIHLIECKACYALENVARAKAALTAAKTNANAIHCPPLLQAEIDLWSGILAAREKDYVTSFSYFYEAFEAFKQQDDPRALASLKYLLLVKVMKNEAQTVRSLIASKSGLKYGGSEIEALGAVADVHEARSLKRFEQIQVKYKAELNDDPIVKHHISDLNETLLEQNILRVLEPFSRVEMSHVAELMDLPLDRTTAKLSEMILDHKLKGTLDQGIGVLIIFDQENVSDIYENALKTIKNTTQVMSALASKALKLQ